MEFPSQVSPGLGEFHGLRGTEPPGGAWKRRATRVPRAWGTGGRDGAKSGQEDPQRKGLSHLGDVGAVNRPNYYLASAGA